MDHCELQSLAIPFNPLCMSREADFLLAVLRGNSPVFDTASLDWDQLLVLAESHGVLPAFCRSYSGRLPNTFLESIRRHWATAALLATELDRLLQLFARNNIEVLPLKGPVLAESLYGSITLRTCDDLDLLVRLTDFARAQAILIGAGFVPVDEAGNYHRVFVANDVLVELHFAIASPSFPQFDLDGAWARSETIRFRGELTRIFDKHDLLLYLVLHCVKHHYARLVWLLDIAYALGGIDDEDAVRLLEMARAVGTEGALLTSCYLAHLIFHVDLPGRIYAAITIEPCISEQAHLLAESVLAGPATVGTPAQNVSLFLNLEIGSRRRWAHRLRFLISTQQDRLWARHYGIPTVWSRYLRPLRLLFRHGPAIALRTVFPRPFRRPDTGKRRL
jgi:hypothetical protein